MVVRNRGIRRGVLLTGTAMFCIIDAAVAQPSPPLKLTDAGFHEIHASLHAAQGRPNEEARLAALKAYVQGHHGSAIKQFERAAWYADKFSQHSLSLMHWHGIGVAADRVQAYIWADLAAERGTKTLLLIREKMWMELSPGQRERVLAGGPAFHARYTDEVAQPRAEAIMRRFASDKTGSRVGFDNQMLDIVGRPSIGTFAPQVGSMSTAYLTSSAATKEQLYGGNRRDVAAYWKDQNRQLDGTVNLGAVTPVRD